MYEIAPWVVFLLWEFWLRGPMIEEGLNLGLPAYYVFLFLCKWESEVWLDFVFGHLVHKGFRPGFACLICASFLVQMRIRSLIEFCFWSLMVHKFCNNVDSPNILLVLGYEWKLSSLLIHLAHLCQCGSFICFLLAILPTN